MSILINWTNPLQSADNIVVYRATAPFDMSDLPAVLATLPATDTEYDDTTALLNVVYYYRIGRVVGSDVVLSKQLALSERPSTGPGSSSLLRGDYHAGYFGEVTSDELFTTAGLSSELSFTAGSVAKASPTWRKFIHDGKIKFIPNGGIRAGIGSWASLYAQGLVYGTDDAGYPAQLTPVNQKRTVTKDGHTYTVRCIKLHGKASQVLPAVVDKATVQDSEFAELFTRIYDTNQFVGATRWNDLPKLDSVSIAAAFASQQLLMAGSNNINQVVALLANGSFTTYGNTGTNTQAAWTPVLELED